MTRSGLPAFQWTHGTGERWDAIARDCIARLEPPEGDQVIGFVYLTDELVSYLPELLRLLKRETGIEDWVGTVGMGICATGIEYYEQPALALMTGAFPAESYRILPGIQGDLEPIEHLMEAWRDGQEACFGVVHGDPRNQAVPQLIEQIAERCRHGFLVGGLSSSRSSYFQIARDITEGGLSGALFAPTVPIATGLTQGCSPIGAKHTVTACDQNVVIELDGRPALDVFQEEIGEVLARDLNRVAGYIFAGLPIAGSDTGDYLVRNIVGIDTEQKLLGIGDLLAHGDTLMFCRRDADSAEQDLRRMLEHVRGRIDGTPRGALYFSCLGRGQHLFGAPSRELGIVAEVLGDIPLVGFFANGEISHNRLYGYTGVLTVFL